MSRSLHIIRLTPSGRGAIATLRVEGPGAAGVVAGQFRSRSGRALDDSPSDRLVVGSLGSEPGEEVVARLHSAEAVELHCHGGLAAVAMIEQTLEAAGGQMVPWQRWAAQHETDPIVAAARIALAEARTQRTAAILLDQYHGALRRAIDEIDVANDRGDRTAARKQAETLLARAGLGRRLTQPWQVVAAGRPNVGKSSLVNALVGYARAIVHPSPGTTRDLVTAQTAVDGWPVELCDTAGLHTGGDAVEQAGMTLARNKLAAADLVLLVFDQSRAWSEADQALLEAWPAALVVHNKSDLPTAQGSRPAGLRVSALRGGAETGAASPPVVEVQRPLQPVGQPAPVSGQQRGEDGIEELARTIAARLVPQPPPLGAAVPFTEQQVGQIAARLAGSSRR